MGVMQSTRGGFLSSPNHAAGMRYWGDTFLKMRELVLRRAVLAGPAAGGVRDVHLPGCSGNFPART